MSCDNRKTESARRDLRIFTDIPLAWDQYVPLKSVYPQIANLLYCSLAELQAMQRKAIEEMHYLEHSAMNWLQDVSPPLEFEYICWPPDFRYSMTLNHVQELSALLQYKLKHLRIRTRLMKLQEYDGKENRDFILKTIKRDPKVSYLYFVEQTTAQNYLIVEVNQLIEEKILTLRGHGKNTCWKFNAKAARKKDTLSEQIQAPVTVLHWRR